MEEMNILDYYLEKLDKEEVREEVRTQATQLEEIRDIEQLKTIAVLLLCQRAQFREQLLKTTEMLAS